MKFKTGIKVSAPATVANLLCGVDSLGLALEYPSDEIIIKEHSKAGVHLTTITGDKKKLSLVSNENAAGIAAQALYTHLVEEYELDPKIGLALELKKRVPIGMGLGSSSASAVAGVMAINECFGRPLERRELLPFAAIGEQLAEGNARINSITPALLGGMFLVRDHEHFDIHRIPVLKGLHVVVVYTQKPLYSNYAQKQIEGTVPLKAAVQQAANLASLISGFYQADLGLIERCLEDYLIENSLVEYIPCLRELQSVAKENGASGCGIAGFGSGVFALCMNSFVAENVKEAMLKVYFDKKIRAKGLVAKVNLEGAKLE